MEDASPRAPRERHRLAAPLQLFFALCLAGPALGRTVEGYAFDETMRMGTTDLQLNGVGVRSVSIVKGYVAALYVPERSVDPQRVLAQAGPKRVVLRMLLGADAATFTKAIDGGMQRNSDAQELDRIRDQIAAFNRDLREASGVKKGDLVYVEFVPEVGTRVTLNGTLLGKPVPGNDFFVAFLKIFIGERVQDPALKAGLLGARGRG